MEGTDIHAGRGGPLQGFQGTVCLEARERTPVLQFFPTTGHRLKRAGSFLLGVKLKKDFLPLETHVSNKQTDEKQFKIEQYHVDIKLIQASERRFRDGPQGKNKTHGGEGTFASRQGSHVIEGSFISFSRLNLEENELTRNKN